MCSLLNRVSLLWLVTAMLFVVGCKKVAKDDIIDDISSIQNLKTLYKGAPAKITADYVLFAKVVSSDMWHNFDYSLIVEDETGGIEIRIYQDEMFRKFEMGKIVKIRCNGMTLEEYGGTLQLFAENIENIIAQDTPVEEVKPHFISSNDISYRYLNCCIRLSDVQFITADLGKSWAETDIYTERFLVFKGTTDTLAVRTSPHATFAASKLPQGSGSIQGVLQQFAGKYSLKVVSDDFLLMDKPRF